MARNEHKKDLRQLSEAYQKVLNEETGDPEWKRQWDNQPKVSDERWEELQNKKKAPKGRLTMPGDGAKEIELDINKVVDPEFDGIDGRDYPDFSDAYITTASYEVAPGEYRDLTEEEIDWVMDKHGDWFYENLMDWIH
tara:strand:+ start:135 stop:548 length:414 start_codon:yes stop_codon:yes gene_type:complete